MSANIPDPMTDRLALNATSASIDKEDYGTGSNERLYLGTMSHFVSCFHCRNKSEAYAEMLVQTYGFHAPLTFFRSILPHQEKETSVRFFHSFTCNQWQHLNK
jgi:hypothetical protein